MKISEIKNRIDKAKKLLSEYSMLDHLLKTMLRAKKEHPEELSFSEQYYENVTKCLTTIKKELDNIFK